MEQLEEVGRGKCRRRLSPEHALFAAGNALRMSKYYQSMGASDFDQEQEDAESEKPVVFVCRLFNCRGVGFHSLRAYEEHYDLLHRNVCRECYRSFLSVRLLDLHLSETHDAFFRVLAKRQPMYACLVDGCARMFTHDDKRSKHLVNDHQYPASFSFHRERRRRPPRHDKTTDATATASTIQERDIDAIKIAKAHARKLKRREKKKQEAARDRQQQQTRAADGGDGMDTKSDTSDRCENAVADVAMQDVTELGDLTQRMKQLMVPKSVSFGRRQPRR